MTTPAEVCCPISIGQPLAKGGVVLAAICAEGVLALNEESRATM
jgi:hypothetical protein